MTQSEASKQVTMSEIQHFVICVHAHVSDSSKLKRKIACNWFGLNTDTTLDVIYFTEKEGEFGVESVYPVSEEIMSYYRSPIRALVIYIHWGSTLQRTETPSGLSANINNYNTGLV